MTPRERCTTSDLYLPHHADLHTCPTQEERAAIDTQNMFCATASDNFCCKVLLSPEPPKKCLVEVPCKRTLQMHMLPITPACDTHHRHACPSGPLRDFPRTDRGSFHATSTCPVSRVQAPPRPGGIYHLTCGDRVQVRSEHLPRARARTRLDAEVKLSSHGSRTTSLGHDTDPPRHRAYSDPRTS